MPAPWTAAAVNPTSPTCNLHPTPAASPPTGDEYGQTRQGNNNYYGHDTQLTHYDWDALEDAKANGWFRCGAVVVSCCTAVAGCCATKLT